MRLSSVFLTILAVSVAIAWGVDHRVQEQKLEAQMHDLSKVHRTLTMRLEEKSQAAISESRKLRSEIDKLLERTSSYAELARVIDWRNADHVNLVRRSLAAELLSTSQRIGGLERLWVFHPWAQSGQNKHFVLIESNERAVDLLALDGPIQIGQATGPGVERTCRIESRTGREFLATRNGFIENCRTD